MKRTLIICFVFGMMGMAPARNVAALTTPDLLSWQYPADEKVIETAVETGFLKPDLSDPYVDGDTASAWKVWIVHERDDKRDLVKQMKQTFAEVDDAVILKSDEHYVNEINIRIHNVLQEGNLEYFDKITVSTLFKSLAIIEGDYNDGQTQPLQLIRNWFGESGIEQMKERFPERYEKLKLQEERQGAPVRRE